MAVFHYFAYASNMCGERMEVTGISAQKVGVARLENYEMAFKQYHDKWHGAMATISPRDGAHVFGVVWKIPLAEREQLDGQERSGEFIQPITVRVTTIDDDTTLDCLAYQQPLHFSDSKPSPQYKAVIVKGARDNSLPREYVEKLTGIEDNRYQGECEVYQSIMTLKI